jgi:hypothetical protein
MCGMQALSAEELGQFQLIVENARREGWLKSDSELVARRFDSSVSVAARRGSSVIEKTYPAGGAYTSGRTLQPG